MARTGSYMRTSMVPRASPALFVWARALPMAVERTASPGTARSTMSTAAASAQRRVVPMASPQSLSTRTAVRSIRASDARGR
ncbi:hypothetical protein KYY02_00780 [Streptomyces pimonensis]|uniref:Secreted protein n=1 Tax=Streptomyces pimonensis TaxID=2860288 RepID=A0ABV4IVR2_9ACTN